MMSCHAKRILGFTFLMGSLIAVEAAKLECQSQEDCPQLSHCVQIPDQPASRCLCLVGYRMNKKFKCVKKEHKNNQSSSPDQNNGSTVATTPPTTKPTATTTAGVFNLLGFQVVTGYSTLFPLTKEECPGIHRSQTSKDLCNNGGTCATDEFGQNYCVCNPLLIGATCNTEVVRNNTGEPKPEDYMFLKSDVYIRSKGNPDLWVMGRHQSASFQDCVRQCYQIRGCQSVQYGPLTLSDNSTVNVCEMVDADFHPRFWPERFDPKAGFISDRKGYQLACCFERRYDWLKESR